MKVVGIIAEYNPFHFGHKYHIEQARNITGADFVVVVMSGSFVQRGEPALVDKWCRTQMALLGGADLVIELPVLFSLSSAEGFAKGGISILEHMGIVNFLCFGSESGSIETLKQAARLAFEQPPEYRAKLKQALNQGSSYPFAVAAAIPGFDSSPNNILSIEYLKALYEMKSSMQPITIQRIGSGYNEQKPEGTFSSATAIRKSILSGNTDKINDSIPFLPILLDQLKRGRGPVKPEHFFEFLKVLIRRMTSEELQAYPLINEGLENRISAVFSSDINDSEIINALVTKRYPATRIMRALSCILLGITSDKLQSPSYIRILGMKTSADPLVRELRNHASLPVTSRLIDLIKSNKPAVVETARLEAIATDIYVTAFSAGNQNTGQDFTTNMLRI